MFQFFILYIIISLLDYKLSYIVLPFEIYVEKYTSTETDNLKYNATKLLNEWFSFNLFSKLQIGSPIQEVSIYINPQSSCFYMKKINIGGVSLDKLSHFFSNEEINLYSFNINNSKTFKDISDEYSGTFYPSQYLMGNDEIYFYTNINSDMNNQKNLEKINNLYFLVNKNNYEGVDCTKEKCGMEIGIKMFSQKDSCPNLNKEFKKSKITDKYIFSLHFSSKQYGSLIFGAYPHEYYPDKYKKEQLSSFYTNPDSFEIHDFNMIADDIISIDSNNIEYKVSNNTKIIFEFYYGFFIGTNSYQEYIENNFFNDLINRNICYKANKTAYTSFMNFDMYFCNEQNLNEIQKFPKLKFFIKNTNTSFIFNFDDLFCKIGDKYYFMVIFDKYQRNYWEIGYPFFKKYDIVFDDDSKTISYYNNIFIDDNNEKSNTFKYLIIIILCVIIIFVLLGVGFYFGKQQYIQRKKRANELDDEEYDYTAGDKINNINENNKIINSE